MKKINITALLLILMACSSSSNRGKWDSGLEKTQTDHQQGIYQNEEKMGDQLPAAGYGGENAQPF